MTAPLRSEILVPARPYMRPLLAATIGMTTAVGLALSLTAVSMAPRTQTVRVSVPPPRAEVAEPAMMTQPETAQPMQASELGLAFSAGGATYMKLADVGESREPMPKHASPRLISEDGVESSIAAVQPADVPAAYRSWQGKEVVVDSKCHTTITGFAVVSRLTGETGYAGVDAEQWTANNVLEHGGAMLVARLAGCQGTFARAAELPPVITPTEIKDDALAAKAKAALLASTPAREAQIDYLDNDQTGTWWDSEATHFDTKVLRHPTTGVTWVSVHASQEHECGGPEINVWGLFRVQPDGTLVAEQLRKLGDLWSIDQLIDVDNDGQLEIIGKPWLGLDTVLTRASGEELDRVSLPFFGCPC